MIENQKGEEFSKREAWKTTKKSAKSACVLFFWLRTRRSARDRDSYTYIITNIAKKVEKQKEHKRKIQLESKVFISWQRKLKEKPFGKPCKNNFQSKRKRKE